LCVDHRTDLRKGPRDSGKRARGKREHERARRTLQVKRDRENRYQGDQSVRAQRPGTPGSVESGPLEQCDRGRGTNGEVVRKNKEKVHDTRGGYNTGRL